MTRTVTLVERRATVVRLPRADVDQLARDHRHVVEVTPTFDRGVYRVTAGGHVGWFHTASRRWEVRPKLPWAAVERVAGRSAGSVPVGPGNGPWAADVANLLAARLADLMRERVAAGLVRDYAERHVEGTTVRGRIDVPRQVRSPSLGSFHLVTDEFTPDVVWNQLPKAAARRLLAVPGLAAEVRDRLAAQVDRFDGVADVAPPSTPLRFDRRTEAYRPLIRLSLALLGGASGPATGDAFLVNLEHLVQDHVGSLLASPGRLPPGWTVEPQATVSLVPDAAGIDPCTLRPDLLVRDPDGQPSGVWDVKWKLLTRAGPHPTDVHQALGYAAAVGAPVAGLIYPGRRSAAVTFRAPGSGVTLRVVRLRVVGPAATCDRSAARLARVVLGPAGRSDRSGP